MEDQDVYGALKENKAIDQENCTETKQNAMVKLKRYREIMLSGTKACVQQHHLWANLVCAGPLARSRVD